MRIVWSSPALAELDRVLAEVHSENPSAADRLAIRVETLVDNLLSQHPWAGRPGRIDGTRELAVSGTRYVIAYRVEQDETMTILTFTHGARRWPDKL